MSDYFSLEAILAEEERVAVKLLCDMGVAEEGDVQDMPFWLVEELMTEGYVQMELPKALKVAHNSSTQLQRISPHYYELGLKVASLLARVEGRNPSEVCEAMVETFGARFLPIIDKAVHWSKEDPAFLSTLVKFEKDLYYRAYRTAAQHNHWKNRGEEKITASVPSSSVGPSLAGSKRKRGC
ncbi:DNA replication complex GINS protein PSF3 [Balamuthia mandrillaris]